ncbi:hypothetical protein SLS53_009167 [Cytospora paraplurivora]|uniref:Uncharacterized protein n=1 Tax=Cytospora paraplurivora TaxID=2898453 RepID=A0AAN9U5Q1_9PEZI
MSKPPFKFDKLLDPHAVVQHHSEVKKTLEKCMAKAKQIKDKQGEIYEQLSPAYRDEVKTTISTWKALTEDVESLRETRNSMSADVCLIRDQLKACAKQRPKDLMAKCDSLGPEGLATLLRINQLAFKGVDIPGLSPEQRDMLRADAKFLASQEEQGSSLVTSLRKELEAERSAAAELRKENNKLQQAHDARRAIVSENVDTIKKLEKKVTKLNDQLQANAKEEAKNLRQIQWYSDLCEKQAARADTQQKRSDEIMAENSRLQTELSKVEEQQKNLQEKLSSAIVSRDDTDANIATVRLTLEQVRLDKARLEEQVKATNKDWAAQLRFVKLQRDELDTKLRAERLNHSEARRAAEEKFAVWHGRATTAEQELRVARSQVANWEKDALQELELVSNLRHELELTKVEKKNAEQSMASSEARVQFLQREVTSTESFSKLREASSAKEHSKLNKTIDNLRRKLEEKEQGISRLQTSVAELTGRKDDARLKAEQVASELRQQKRQQETSLAESKQANVRLENRNSVLRGDISSLEDGVKSLEMDLVSTKAELHSKAERLKAVEAKLERQNEDTMRLRGESVEHLKTQANSTYDQLQALMASLESTRKDLAEEQQQKVELKEEMRRSQAQFERTVGDRVAETLRDLHTLNEELTSHKEAKTVLQKENSELVASIDVEKSALRESQNMLQQSEAKFRRSEENSVRYTSQLKLVFQHICPNISPAVVGDIIEGLQCPYHTYDGTDFEQPSWLLLTSWDAEGVGPACSDVQSETSVEILIIKLFEACCPERVSTPSCLALTRTLVRVLGTCAAIQPDLLTRLAQVFVGSVSLKREDAFEAGFAFFQMMSIAEGRWRILSETPGPISSLWIELRINLAQTLSRTRYRKLFTAMQFDIEPHEVPVPRRTWGNMLVMCEPSWPKAVAFDLERRSIRFFVKTRWTINTSEKQIRIIPVPGEDAIILSPWILDDSFWTTKNFWGDD